MTLSVSITQEQVFATLGGFISGVVPAGVEINRGVVNRVAMPAPEPGFISMTAGRLRLHRTPQESWDKSGAPPSVVSYEQGTLIRIQLDCYGATSGDWAVMLASLMRTEYACAALAPIAPLFADDPKQAALRDGEEQYETRWIVEAHLQYNPIISAPMQFADRLAVTTIEVDERYPP